MEKVDYFLGRRFLRKPPFFKKDHFNAGHLTMPASLSSSFKKLKKSVENGIRPGFAESQPSNY
jgi:hypothetical protein